MTPMQSLALSRARDALAIAANDDAPPLASFIGLTPRQVREFSILRAVAQMATGQWQPGCGLEREASDTLAAKLGESGLHSHRLYVPLEVQHRDLTVASATGGGHLVSGSNQSFAELLRARSVTLSLGATRLTELVGNCLVPRQTATVTTGWLASEAAAPSESQPTLGQLALTPKTVGAYTEISRQLMLQSSPSAELLLTRDLAATAALALDAAAIAGTGTLGQPLGITGTAGIQTFSGTSLALAGLLAAQASLGDALTPACAFATTRAVAQVLAARQKAASTSTFLWEGSVAAGTLSGLPAMTSGQMPSGGLILGNWAELLVAEWGQLAVEVNPYANFPAGIVGFRTLYSVDTAPRTPAAFAYASAVT